MTSSEPRSLLRAVLPIAAIVSVVLFVGATLAVAGDTLGFDYLAYHVAARRVLEGQPLYDMGFEAIKGWGLFYYPPLFLPFILPFGLLDPTFATWLWIAVILAAFFIGVAILPVSRTIKWLDRPPRGPVVAVRVRRQARAGRTAVVPDIRGRVAVDGQSRPTGAQRGRRDRDQDAAGADPRLGRVDPEAAGGGHRRHHAGRPLGGRHAHHGTCVMGRLPDADAPGCRSGPDGAQHDAGGGAVQVGSRPGHRRRTAGRQHRHRR